MPKILGMPTVITGIITALLIWIIRPDKYCDVYKYKCHRGSDESSSLTVNLISNMPGMNCAVAVCKNNKYKTNKEGKDISFFSFPKDDQRKAWIVKCKRADKFNPSTSFVCSENFEEKDFELNLKKQLLGGQTKRKVNNFGDHSNNGKFRTWHVVLPFGINSDIILHNYGICVSFNLGALEEQTDCHGKIGNGRNSNNSKKCSEMVSPEQRARMCATDDSYNWIQQLLFNLLLVFSTSVVALKLTNKICSVLHSENTCALQICRRRRSKKHKEKLSNSTRHNKNNNNTNSTYVKRHTCSFKK